MKDKKYVYLFNEGNASMRDLLGGKGANLAEMINIGIPVPEGFTITTEACIKYYGENKTISEDIIEEIYSALGKIEKKTGREFGNKENPLLVSVRSGAKISMPGMMDTILNLGLNDKTVKGLGRLAGNERFAYDSYGRFIQMFSTVVMGIEKKKFEDVLDNAENAELTVSNLKEIIVKFKKIYNDETGSNFPQNPEKQLLQAIAAVFMSWYNPRAVIYRKSNEISDKWGTAVNVQSMVFGNMGETSGTGVAFTRNPATGEKSVFGEYLINAQGEDVVAGIGTPQPIINLKEDLPECYSQFMNIAHKLENHYRDMQDVEFTIERGKLYFLQTRSGRRTAQAALRIAVDMVEENLIGKEEAVLKVEPRQLDTLLHLNFDRDEIKRADAIAKGLPASQGAACGRIYFTSEDAKKHHDHGEKVILVKTETLPEDIEGISASEGILTTKGGMTSRAAVTARAMGICCVTSCNNLIIDEKAGNFKVKDRLYRKGDYISLDGSTGNVYGKFMQTVLPEVSGYFSIFMGWTDDIKKMAVRANADTPGDVKKAVEFGAEGIGLCRTERMFFNEDRISYIREMIVFSTEEQKRRALYKLLPKQKEDFIKIYEAAGERSVTIRLLDSSLYEFLPADESSIKNLSDKMGVNFQKLKNTVRSFHEFNPMMGQRGCRLAISYPEIAEIQTKAIMEAAIDVKREKGYNIVPEIMVPLVGGVRELKYVKNIVVKTADEVIKASGIELGYKVGTMIEVPRAALTADKIAAEAEFFSFGTDDLTQMTFGFSRDDLSKSLSSYCDKKIYEFDPFQKIDRAGVGKLIDMAVKLGRETKADIGLGICGEQGRDPSSIEFFHDIGFDYISCLPVKIPVARLAAAQAQIKDPR
ncbi:pyruvate, phosphate dikinase [uncultured Clostridium sp.]|uniref:pyruvate, phosphate dikinase n=1 Tax=uncultured Clostridium sp. TaxID=59620 RepID=UPI0025CBAE37|nr:pyruvate, phosphate dikinase [uncultured Clostridium sp.]